MNLKNDSLLVIAGITIDEVFRCEFGKGHVPGGSHHSEVFFELTSAVDNS